MAFFSWYYSQGLKKLWRYLGTLVLVVADNFSLKILLRTLFSPWRRDVQRTSDIRALLQVFFSNIMSRFIGAIVRTIIIVTGALVELVVIAAGLVFLSIYLIFPISSIVMIILGVALMV